MSKKTSFKRRKALLDTSFIINLLDKESIYHEQAEKFYSELIKQETEFYISVIAIGEYLVKGSIDDLPLTLWKILPFNHEDANKSAELHRSLLERKFETENFRECIKDDLKLLAQLEAQQIGLILTADKGFKKIVNALDLDKEVLDITETDFNKYFGKDPTLFD